MNAEDRWLVGWGLGYAAAGGASLLIPLYALELGAGPMAVGLLASVSAFAGVPGSVIWGRRADRTRRRRFVAVALGAVAVALLLSPTIDAPLLLLVPNGVVWFVVGAAAPVLSLSMVAGRPESEWEPRIARLNAYQGYGWLGGLVVGAVWSNLASRVVSPITAQRLLFGVLAACTVAGAALVVRWYPKTNPADGSATTGGRPSRLTRLGARVRSRQLRPVHARLDRVHGRIRGVSVRKVVARVDRGLAVYLLGATLFFLGFAAFFGPLPAYLVDSGYSSNQVYVLFVVSSAGSAVFYTRTASIVARTDVGFLHAGALAGRGLLLPSVLVLGGIAYGFVGLLAVFALIGVFWAVIAVTGTGLVARLASTELRGHALGVYTALSGVGTGIGSALGGAVAATGSYPVAFLTAAALVLVGAVVTLLSRSSGEA